MIMINTMRTKNLLTSCLRVCVALSLIELMILFLLIRFGPHFRISMREPIKLVKSRLFETYRHEYETFSHLPGETTDAFFQRFLATVNKLKANIVVLPYTDHDQALKLLHSLDRDVWGTKVDSIIESAGYETLSTKKLFYKLKSTEVDMKLSSKHANPTDPHSLFSCQGQNGLLLLTNQACLLPCLLCCLFQRNSLRYSRTRSLP